MSPPQQDDMGPLFLHIEDDQGVFWNWNFTAPDSDFSFSTAELSTTSSMGKSKSSDSIIFSECKGRE